MQKLQPHKVGCLVVNNGGFIDSVIQKFEEAKLLLREMRKAFEAEDPEFIHYANAFVNSARSVTLVMQKSGRNANKQKFDAWYEEEKAKIFNEDDYDYILLRNISDHQKPINSKQRVYSFSVGEPNKRFNNVTVSLSMETLTAEAHSLSDETITGVPVTSVEKDIVVEEFDDDKQKIVRKKYFIKGLILYSEKLESMVKDFEQFMRELNVL